MRVLGLTGGIACGKSNVSEELGRLGAAVIDGDRLSRELTEAGGAALGAIRESFGDEVFEQDGTLNRRALGDAVFADAEARARLDGIMQPMIREMIDRRIDAARQAGKQVCVLDMPLLYEAGLDALCDRVWCTWIPEEEQISRLMARDGFTREQAVARMKSQLPAKEKADRAQVVIDTSGSIRYTKAMIPALYAEEERLAQEPGRGGSHGDEHAAPQDNAEG